MKTFTATPDDLSHDWHVVDADRRAARSAGERGRAAHPRQAQADLHAAHGRRRLRRRDQRREGEADRPQARTKKYFQHTGYMGHERFTAARDMLAKHPDRVIEKAVFGMLPKTSLARQKMRGKLKVYAGAEHPHAAQQPKPFSVTPVEGERMTASARVPLAGRRPPQDQRRPRVPDARHRQVGHQRPHPG